ncbi:thymidylate synthase [Rhizobium mongolense]|uniref:thymidylate synthase n=1 Tax=Rhizobium TaxID=379 RepID=UPI0018907CEC|nr:MULTISPECIES: thymidylate synthase [Rhizobium]QPB21812.1 thymidylate synthase [Rhizobium sp. 007]ULJ72898.1 thymidylate synthase [Rhizobium gallicum]WFU85742.1 thymidylate synthase [Rhizobium sp. CC1099]
MQRHPEYQYLDIMSHLLEKGDRRMDRTGEGTLSTFGAMMRFDLSDGSFPAFTTKKVFWKTAVKEMLWFLTGQTNIQSLLKENVKIWTDWPLAAYRKATGEEISQDRFEKRVLEDDAFAAKWGDLGPVYGKQWRRWLDRNGVEHDQIGALVHSLKTNPTSRRMLFHAWNVGEIDQMALPPCHMTYQFHVSGLQRGSGRPQLSMLVNQRSCDIFLGAPFNICQQAALLAMVAQQVQMDRGELIWVGGDTHLYLNHLDQAKEQLARKPMPFPKLVLTREPDEIDGYRIDDFEVVGYQSHDRIDAPVAV